MVTVTLCRKLAALSEIPDGIDIGRQETTTDVQASIGTDKMAHFVLGNRRTAGTLESIARAREWNNPRRTWTGNESPTGPPFAYQAMRGSEGREMRTRRGHLPVQIGVRLQSSLKAWLDQRADAEETNVSTLVRQWIQEHAKRDLQCREVMQDDHLQV
jgi:hypothetical protein